MSVCLETQILQLVLVPARLLVVLEVAVVKAAAVGELLGADANLGAEVGVLDATEVLLPLLC